MITLFLMFSCQTFKYQKTVIKVMKKTVLLLLFLTTILSVYATINNGPTLVLGKIDKNEYGFVSCERQLPPSTARQRDLYCWIDKDASGRWTTEERVLGTGISSAGVKLFTFDTETQKWWSSWRTKIPPCSGQWAYLAGHEYDKLFEYHQCKKDDHIGTYWCCPDSAFMVRQIAKPPQGYQPPAPKAMPGVNATSSNSNQLTGALLVLNNNQWLSLKAGRLNYRKYELRAFEHEKQRCATGGTDLRIIDQKYGSYFADTRQIKEGARAFFLTPEKVITLISACDF